MTTAAWTIQAFHTFLTQSLVAICITLLFSSPVVVYSWLGIRWRSQALPNLHQTIKWTCMSLDSAIHNVYFSTYFNNWPVTISYSYYDTGCTEFAGSANPASGHVTGGPYGSKAVKWVSTNCCNANTCCTGMFETPPLHCSFLSTSSSFSSFSCKTLFMRAKIFVWISLKLPLGVQKLRVQRVRLCELWTVQILHQRRVGWVVLQLYSLREHGLTLFWWWCHELE